MPSSLISPPNDLGAANLRILELEKQVQIWKTRYQSVSGQKDLLKAVLRITCEDCSLKNEQFESLYTNLSHNPVWQDIQTEKEEEVSACKECEVESLPAPQKNISAVKPPSLQHLKQTSSSNCPFESLPKELFVWFYRNLGFADLCRAASVCKSWKQLADDKFTWERLFVTRWRLELHNKSSAWKCSPSMVKPWKTQFRDRIVTEKHWVEGKPNIITMMGHTGSVTCLRYDDSRLISASDDGSLMLWEMNNSDSKRSFPMVQQHHKNTKMTRRISSFTGHGGPVWSLDFSGDTLISGSYDKTIRVWSIRRAALQTTLRGHSSWVSCVSLHGDRVVSGSWDGSIKVWRLPHLGKTERKSTMGRYFDSKIRNVDTGACLTTLREGGPANVIYCHQWDVSTGRVVVGTRSTAVQVWDLNIEELSQTYMGHTKQVYALQADDAKVVSASGDHTVKVWDPHTGRCEATLTGHTGPVMTMQFNDAYQMVTGSYDKTIKVWDMRTGRVVNTLEGHSSAIFSLQFDYDKIVSGSADMSLKLWDFNKQYINT